MSACIGAETTSATGVGNAHTTVGVEAPPVLPDAGKVHFNKRVEEIAANQPIESGTVLIGDSITEAWMWQTETETYPFSAPVINHGVGWDVTEGVVARLPLIEQSDPSQIFIKIGTNDISNGVPLEDMTQHFEILLSRLRSSEPQAQIFVQSVLPREADKLEKIARVNAMQAKLSEKYGSIYIDLTSNFAAQDGTLRAEFTDDNLHLNAAGYAAWGEALSPYVD